MTFVLVAVALACVGLPAAALWRVSESTGTRDGDEVARDRIRLAAAQLEEDLGHLSRARNAETIAAGITKREGCRVALNTAPPR